MGQQTTYSLVTLNAPPGFVSKLESFKIIEGQKAEIAVKIIANPKANIKFTKKEIIIKEDSRIRNIDEDNGSFM